MKFFDIFQLALKNFVNRKSRIVLTMLGIAVGIAVITFLISVGYGLQRTILDRITTAEALLTIDVVAPDEGEVVLNDPLVQRFKDIEHVQKVSPRRTLSSVVNYQDVYTETTVHVINDDYLELAGYDIVHETESEKMNGVVVSETVVRLLGIEPSEGVGESISLRLRGADEEEISSVEDDFVVAGILSEEVVDNIAFISQEVPLDISMPPYDLVKIQVEDERHLEVVQQQFVQQGFIVSALSDLVRQARQVFTILQIILSVFGVFSLLVAAIGLLNTMTISLLERTNEIGIMRALGATKKDIQGLFLIESSLIGFIGGIVGLLIGAVSGFVFNMVLNIVVRTLGGRAIDIFSTPLWFVLLVLVSSVFVGFMSGFFPARRASRLNTLAALRYK